MQSRAPRGGRWQAAIRRAAQRMCCETRTPRYHYEDARSPSLLTGITDEANVRTATLGYDAQGRLTSASQAGTSQPLSLAYGSNQTTVTDTSGPNGSSASRTYTIATTASGRLYASSLSAPCSQCASTAQSTVMGTSAGATGLPTKTVAHDGTVTFYTYDAKGRETEKATFPASFATSTTKPALANATTVTSTKWHGTFNLPTKRAEPGKITAYTYSATTGNLTGQSETQTTDTTGAAKFTAAQATNTPIKSTGWSYNATSQLPTTIVERETAFGSTVAVQVGKLTYTHDALGNATSLKDLQVTPNLTATFSSYTKSGLLLAGADETGTSFTLTLDSRERLKTYQYGTSYTSQYTYLSWGGLSQTTSSDGDVLKYFYTPSQQLIRMEENGEVVYRVALNGSMHKFRDRLLALRRLPIQVVNSIVPQAHAVPLVIPFIVGAGEFVTCQALRAAATRAVPYMLMGIRAWGAAERVIAIGERDTSNADDKSDAIPIPAKPNQSQSCTCNCRARENKNRVSEKDCKNCQVVKFVIAQATASSCNEAQKLAKAEAKKTLGEQAKHDGCVCTDSKGNRIRTTGG